MFKITGKWWAALLLLLFACCSPSQKEEASDNDEYGEYEIADPRLPESAREPKTHVIEIIQMKFVPEVLNVKKGDKVVWVNKDLVEHDVTEQYRNAWASAKLPSGATWEMVFSKSESYYCNLHVVMKGKVVVDGADIALLDLASGITMCK